jgi:hypothetical protein
VITRSEWTQRMLAMFDDEPCPICGHVIRAYHLDDEGVVWSWCETCQRDLWTAHLTIPTKFAAEPPGANLPF